MTQPTLPSAQQVLLALREARSKLEAYEQRASEPIAIIGMGCRFPGAPDLAAFWQLLHNGVDAITDIPAERWDVAAHYSPDRDDHTRMYTRQIGALAGVEHFDAGFFGISPREANGLDPQQRLLLEVCWEALEQAGLAPDRLRRTPTGVFIGLSTNDYRDRSGAAVTGQGDHHQFLGNLPNMAAGRIAYHLGLQGPTLQLDTACSSSLVAVHLACQSLRNGEANLALAGGVNLILAPENMIGLCQVQALAPDGRCKTFDVAADGYGRGEGCGVVVLKRLADALAAGDTILALIRGSAVNHDGPSSNLTAPNGPAQEAVVRQALAQARLQPKAVSYIEAHGTGTALGDPIEIGALTAVFGQRRQPLWVGSVKTNIGHLEAAAGIAGLIKVVLALQYGVIPPHLHLHTPTPLIDWAATPVQVPTARTSWPVSATTDTRIAGVSAFGFSGTNAHLILEQAPAVATRATAGVERPVHLLTLSAKSEPALRELVHRYAEFSTQHRDINLGDLCYTAHTGRTHFTHRLSVTAASTHQLQTKLTAYGADALPTGVSRGTVAEYKPVPPVAFLFTGQGSQYVGMGRELYATQPHFRQTIDRCEALLQEQMGASILAVLYPEQRAEGSNASALPGEQSQIQTLNSKIDETTYTQPALFALEYALAQLWRSWGVEPAFVLGHSVGELVAACVAGVFSLEDGLRLVAARGRLMGALPHDGVMVSLLAAEVRVQAAIAPYGHEVSIAAVNGPQSLVISGKRAAVQAVATSLAAEGAKATPLTVSHAFHSPLMAPMLAAFRQVAASITYAPPTIPLVSNVTGELAGDEITTPDYWVRHVRETVRFADGVRTLHAQGVDILLEVGPQPILLGMAQIILDVSLPVVDWNALAEQSKRQKPKAKLYLPSLHRGQSDWQQMLDSLGQLYVQGVSIDWQSFDQAYVRHKVVLPTYPFQRQRYWIETAKRRRVEPLRPLIDKMTKSPVVNETIFETAFSVAALPFLADHRVYNEIVSPGACQVALLLNAAELTFGTHPLLQLADIVLPQALVIPDDGERTVQAVLTPQAGNGSGPKATFQLISFDPQNAMAKPVTHATGTLAAQPANAPVVIDVAALRSRCDQPRDIAAFYAEATQQQIVLGPSFRWLIAAWLAPAGEPAEALAKLRAPAGVNRLNEYLLHPGLLDACFQVAVLARANGPPEETLLPFAVGALQLVHPTNHALVGESWWCHAIQTGTYTWDIQLLDEQGRLLTRIDHFAVRVAPPAAVRGEQTWQDWLYEVQWQSRPYFGLPPTYLPSPQTVAQSVQAIAPRFWDEQAGEHYQTYLAGLEQLSIDYVLAAFTKLGVTLQPGTRWPTAQLGQQAGLLPRYRRLLARLLAMLAEIGIVQQQGEQWVVMKNPILHDPQTQAARLRTRHAAGAELTLLMRCGEQLSEVLRGVQEPLELLFPAGDASLLTQLYTDSALAQVMNRLVQEAVQEALTELPGGYGVRIVEIGAGTGSTTAGLLPLLPARQTEYWCTDIGPAFLTGAQQRFADYDFVRYQLLDIEQAPSTQGFTPHTVDLVLAANVLHATRNLRETLTHVRHLLQPGGWLVLLEATTRHRWVDLTFGLTEGWWRFADSRLDHPLLTADQWQCLLQANGFQTVKTVELGGQALILAQAAFGQVQEPLQPTVAEVAEAWLLFTDEQGVGEALATLLRQRGERTILVHAARNDSRRDSQTYQICPDSIEAYQQLLRNLPALRGVVYLWSLDAPPLMPGADQLHAAQQGCGSVLHLVQALLHQQVKLSGFWLVTKGTQAVTRQDAVLGVAQAPLWGMGKVIALEHPELHCVCLDLDNAGTNTTLAAQLCAELIGAAGDGRERQVALRWDARYVARLHRYQPAPVLALPAGPYALAIRQRGTLDNLCLQPVVRRAPGRGEVELQVQAAGLNFRDVLNALGLVPGDPGPLGGECAGMIVAVGDGVTQFAIGDAVFAIAAGSLGQYVTVNAALVAHKPPILSPVEAATIPVAFLTAYYGLHELAAIKAGDRVLIHAATGGVGQAALQLAQRAGAELFATASPGKWDALRQFGITHIYNSRTLAFAQQVLADTNGHGVDLVLNSLTGPGFIEANLAVLAAGGRLVEMSKREIWSAAQVAAVRPDVHYIPFDLVGITSSHPQVVQRMFASILDLVVQNKLRALPYQAFSMCDAVRAFRTMQEAKHIGKLVLTPPAPPPTMRADATYLITGGLGGLGLAIAEWLTEQGARHLVLIGRSRPSAAAQAQLDALSARGVAVTVSQTDVTDLEQLTSVLHSIDPHYPLRGVIHAAGVLADGVLLQQSWGDFVRVLGPKVAGAWHLHQLTKQKALDFFVLFSSAASLLGNRGQANHAAANAFLDALAHYRRAQGLPALSINWGIWSEIGVVADLARTQKQQLAAQGLGVIAPQQGIQAFAYLLGQPAGQVGVVPIEWTKFLAGASAPPPFYTNVARSAAIVDRQERAPRMDLRQQLRQATGATRRTLLAQHVRIRAARVLGLPSPEQLHGQQSLANFGMDSLMALEFRNQLTTDLQVTVPLVAFVDASLEELVAKLDEQLLHAGVTQASASLPTRSPNSAEDTSAENEVEEFLL